MPFLDLEVAVAEGGGVEVADILITVEKRRLVRHVLELERFGDENLEIGFTNIISAAIVRVSEAVEREQGARGRRRGCEEFCNEKISSSENLSSGVGA